MVKKITKIILIILAVIVVLAGALFAWLSIAEFKPEPVMAVDVAPTVPGSPTLHEGDTLNILGWNIGYGGLGAESDFFMDGGEEVKAADKNTVLRYLCGIEDVLHVHEEYDIIMLQEVDENSSRTYGIDETEYLDRRNHTFAYNYSCPFVPFPLPPIGRVNSGLFTDTVYPIDSAERIALPCPFSWPVSTANLKRCLLVSYIPVEDSDKQLVVVNLHLEAYDDGEGKIAQTNQLREFIQSEYEKGNYVIAGGDFNQIFPGGLDKYPNEHPELWEPGIIEDDILPDGWTIAYDLETPSCRLLNQPYDPDDTANTQYYVIDGFLLSPNVELLNVRTLDEGFVNSDHNPVNIQVTLK